MSRVGKKPIPIPDGVKVSLDGRTVKVEGPQGKLAWTPRAEITVAVDAAAKLVTVTRVNDERMAKSLHGLSRTLIANMLEGVSKGYSKSLELYGVGYSVAVAGAKFNMTCGFSHSATFDIPPTIKVAVTTPQARGDNEPAKFTVSGPDKQMVGEFAARVHKTRPPEPYKGKGVRYAGERVRRKVGKAFAGAGGGT
jgi:large subunit ribosomal protein L6